MLSLVNCYSLVFTMAKSKARFGEDFPDEWHQQTEGLDRLSLLMLYRIANDIGKQTNYHWEIYSGYPQWIEGDVPKDINSIRTIFGPLADCLFEKAFDLPYQSRRLIPKGRRYVALYFWYLSIEGIIDFTTQFGGIESAYHDLAIIHDLKPSYFGKEYKNFKHDSNRINRPNAYNELYTVMLLLPVNARTEIQKDLSKILDKK